MSTFDFADLLLRAHRGSKPDRSLTRCRSHRSFTRQPSERPYTFRSLPTDTLYRWCRRVSPPSRNAVESDGRVEGANEVCSGVGATVERSGGWARQHGRALPHIRREPCDGVHLGRAIQRSELQLSGARGAVAQAEDLTNGVGAGDGGPDRSRTEEVPALGTAEAARNARRAQSWAVRTERERDGESAQEARHD